MGKPSTCATASSLSKPHKVRRSNHPNAHIDHITTGALVGPPWSKRENGYVLTENVLQGISLYYEPHCDFDADSVASVGAVDVVVSPPCNQELVGYPLVKGNTDSVKLVSLLKPAALIALCNAEFDASGPLDALIVETVRVVLGWCCVGSNDKWQHRVVWSSWVRSCMRLGLPRRCLHQHRLGRRWQ